MNWLEGVRRVGVICFTGVAGDEECIGSHALFVLGSGLGSGNRRDYSLDYVLVIQRHIICQVYPMANFYCAVATADTRASNNITDFSSILIELISVLDAEED